MTAMPDVQLPPMEEAVKGSRIVTILGAPPGRRRIRLPDGLEDGFAVILARALTALTRLREGDGIPSVVYLQYIGEADVCKHLGGTSAIHFTKVGNWLAIAGRNGADPGCAVTALRWRLRKRLPKRATIRKFRRKI